MNFDTCTVMYPQPNQDAPSFLSGSTHKHGKSLAVVILWNSLLQFILYLEKQRLHEGGGTFLLKNSF